MPLKSQETQTGLYTSYKYNNASRLAFMSIYAYHSSSSHKTLKRNDYWLTQVGDGKILRYAKTNHFSISYKIKF